MKKRMKENWKPHKFLTIGYWLIYDMDISLNIKTSSTILKNIIIVGCKSNFHNEVKKKSEDIGVSPWMNHKRNIAGGNYYQDKEKGIWNPCLKPFTKDNYSHEKFFIKREKIKTSKRYFWHWAKWNNYTKLAFSQKNSNIWAKYIL